MSAVVPASTLGVLLAVLAGFVGSTFGTGWEVGSAYVFAATAVALRLFRPEPLRRGAGVDSRRWRGKSLRIGWVVKPLIAIVVAATFLVVWDWRSREQVSGSANASMSIADSVAHLALILAYWVWVIRVDRGHVSLLPLLLSVLMACLVGGGGGSTLISQAAIAMAGILGFVVVSQIVFRRPAADDPSREAAGERGWLFGGGMNDLVAGLVLSGVLIATSMLTRLTSDMLPQMQQRVVNYVAESMDRGNMPPSPAGGLYVRGSQFGTVRSRMLDAPDALALRGYSVTAPGYLRGSVFARYGDRRWSYPDRTDGVRDRDDMEIGRQSGPDVIRRHPVGPGRASVTGVSRSRMRRFMVAVDVGEPKIPIEIHGIPSKGSIVFTPLATRWFEAAALVIAISEDGVVVSGVDVDAPYVAGVSESVPVERLSSERMKEYLAVPAEAELMTALLAEDLCADVSTARGKAEQVAQHFQNNFEYSLFHFVRARDDDPIEHFLRTEHPAHCEYFATAAALILRQAGVPTRYVTGYVMAERDEANRSWIARNANAHAWVEAYDSESERWFPVEATPGRQYQTLQVDDQAAGSELGSSLSATGADAAAEAWYRRAWAAVSEFRVTDWLIIMLRVARIPLFLFLLLVLWTRIRRNRLTGLDPSDRRSLRMLGEVDRRVRRHALVRGDAETLHRFADRVETTARADNVGPAAETLRRAADWYREYASARYRGGEPKPLIAVPG